MWRCRSKNHRWMGRTLTMKKLGSHIWKEAAWRSRLQRHAQSGTSVAAMCRDKSVALLPVASKIEDHMCASGAMSLNTAERRVEAKLETVSLIFTNGPAICSAERTGTRGSSTRGPEVQWNDYAQLNITVPLHTAPPQAIVH